MNPLDSARVIFVLGAGASVPLGMPTTVSLLAKLERKTKLGRLAAEIHKSAAYRFRIGRTTSISKISSSISTKFSCSCAAVVGDGISPHIVPSGLVRAVWTASQSRSRFRGWMPLIPRAIIS